MKNKDGILKEYLSDGKRFADLFNVVMFQGQSVLKPEDLHMLDTNEISKSKRDGKTTIKQKQRDLVRMVAHDTMFVILGIENQTAIDYTMAVRQMEYDTMRYRNQINQISKKHKEAADLKKGEEYLSGFCKEDKVMPVITLVLYYGSKKWDGSIDLYGMMDLPNEYQALWEYIPNYRMNLLEITEMGDEQFQTFYSDLRLLLPLIKYQSDKERFRQYIFANKEEYSVIQEEVYDTICVMLDGKGLEKTKKFAYNEKEATIDMCKALEDMRKEAVEETTKKVTEETTKKVTEETIQNLLREGVDVSIIAKATKISVEEVKELEKTLFEKV